MKTTNKTYHALSLVYFIYVTLLLCCTVLCHDVLLIYLLLQQYKSSVTKVFITCISKYNDSDENDSNVTLMTSMMMVHVIHSL